MPNECTPYYQILSNVLQANLNTHQVDSLYERFVVVTAHQLSKRLILNYSPTLGSLLNMVELGGRSHLDCGPFQTLS